MNEVMPIGEFSERCGLSPKRLRSYAAGGLLTPTAVDPDSGYRYYSAGQLSEARLIDALRRAGMPLAEIGPFLRDRSCERLEAWAAHLRVEATRKQEALAAAREMISSETAPAADERSPMVQLRAVGRTEVGRVRPTNEDAIVTGERLVAVADGMGGHAAGEVASMLATGLLAATFTGRSLDELQAAVRAANWLVWQRGSTAPELEGMGTTLCAAGLVGDGTLAVANVGDSRVYLAQGGSLRQVTADHTVTAESVRRGELSEAEAAAHPHRHVLTRALGVGPDVQVDGAVLAVAAGDRLLLCSDGLFNEVPDRDMESLMLSGATTEATVDALIDQALSEGGNDNISVVIAEVCS